MIRWRTPHDRVDIEFAEAEREIITNRSDSHPKTIDNGSGKEDTIDDSDIL